MSSPLDINDGDRVAAAERASEHGLAARLSYRIGLRFGAKKKDKKNNRIPLFKEATTSVNIAHQRKWMSALFSLLLEMNDAIPVAG